MNRLFLFVTMILLPTFVNAQQDLRDPSYIYYQEKPGASYSVAYGYIKEESLYFLKAHYTRILTSIDSMQIPALRSIVVGIILTAGRYQGIQATLK